MFLLVTAPDASLARPIDDLTKFDVSSYIKEVKAKIFERSGFGLRSLARIFKAMDERGDGLDWTWMTSDGDSLTTVFQSLKKKLRRQVLNAFDRDSIIAIACYMATAITTVLLTSTYEFLLPFLVALKGELTPDSSL